MIIITGYTGNDTFSIIFAFEKIQSRLGKKESYEKSFYQHRFQSTEFPLEEEPRKFVPDNTRDKYTGSIARDSITIRRIRRDECHEE